MSADSNKLLEGFRRRRDESSFRRLYRHHTPTLYALALRMQGNPSDAEDTVQEAWVRAVSRLDGFRGASRFSTWIAGILINCVREQSRRQQKTSRETDADSVIAPFPGTANHGRSIDLQAALKQLPLGFREVVVLHDLQGFTHAEIAAMLDIAEGTSKSQLNRGRARLRKLLTPDAGNEQRESP